MLKEVLCSKTAKVPEGSLADIARPAFPSSSSFVDKHDTRTQTQTQNSNDARNNPLLHRTSPFESFNIIKMGDPGQSPNENGPPTPYWTNFLPKSTNNATAFNNNAVSGSTHGSPILDVTDFALFQTVDPIDLTASYRQLNNEQ